MQDAKFSGLNLEDFEAFIVCQSHHSPDTGKIAYSVMQIAKREKNEVVSKHHLLMLLNVMEKKIIGKIHPDSHISPHFFWVVKKTFRFK